MKKLLIVLFSASAFFSLQVTAFAADASKVNSGDTSFILVSTALVFLMTPGLALFYGGMVRKKNVLSTIMYSFIVMGLISIQWILLGYTLSFGTDHGSIIGGLDFFGLSGVGSEPNSYAPTIPAIVFMAFQLMFAMITPALISGSVVERMKFPAFLIFILLWATLVYDPIAHWVWGEGGFLRKLGALDFAGGNVVHISSGYSALVAALVLGKRKGHGAKTSPHHIPMTILGAGLLWFGWFGFNAGSALSANDLAGIAFVNTNSAAAAAALSWLMIEWAYRGKPTLLGTASGAIAGLVSITPGAGFVTPLSSIVIGLIGGAVCYFGVSVMKSKLGYDDTLDAFGCHGIGGTWGALATGLFTTKLINPNGADGLFYGNPQQFGIQALSVLVTVGYAVIATYIILKVIALFVSLRATLEEEDHGLDLSVHGESAYPDFT